MCPILLDQNKKYLREQKCITITAVVQKPYIDEFSTQIEVYGSKDGWIISSIRVEKQLQ